MRRVASAGFFALVLSCGLSWVSAASAGPATDQLSDGIDRAFIVVGDPDLRGEDKAVERKTAIGRLADEIFDFAEMSRRALGRHWHQLTAAEREDFTRVFSELLKRSYLVRSAEHASQKPVFRGETVEGPDVIVRTALVLGNGTNVPVDFAMHNASDRWRVHDVSIDGMGLVANYRAQFSRIIRLSSYASLMTKLQSQLSDFAAPTSPSASAP